MQILKACEIAGFSKKKRIQYDKDTYDERRFYSELYTARREGMDEGMEKGKAHAFEGFPCRHAIKNPIRLEADRQMNILCLQLSF